MPICPVCGKTFKSLGIARHRAMHTDNQNKKDNEQKEKPAA